ncbi:MAG: serine/threonine-protein kinase, partial [Planctomycetota bacterium]
MTSPQDRALARLAVEKKLVPRQAMEEALRESERTGGKDPWSILVSRGVLAQKDLKDLRALTPLTLRGGEQANPTLPTPGQRSASGRPTPRPSSAAAPNYVFGGKYQLLDELGSGGMGVVFRARDTGLKRDVAIKLVDLGPRPSPDMIARFEREARTTARLRHPAIIPVHDFGEFNGRHYLVMDFVHGKSLGERIDKKDLPLRQAVEVVRAVAEGIAYAHAEGIIHRDLKPDNILVDQAGKGFVTDFGLAKESGTKTALTKTGMAIGTAVYMSPEAAAGEIKSFGPRTDVYGLGAILYEVLAGEPPFSGETTVGILAAVLSKDPTPPSLLRPGAPRDLEVVCLKAMEKEPSRRYPSANEFADELGRWLDGEPIRARPSGTMATILR